MCTLSAHQRPRRVYTCSEAMPCNGGHRILRITREYSRSTPIAHTHQCTRTNQVLAWDAAPLKEDTHCFPCGQTRTRHCKEQISGFSRFSLTPHSALLSLWVYSFPSGFPSGRAPVRPGPSLYTHDAAAKPQSANADTTAIYIRGSPHRCAHKAIAANRLSGGTPAFASPNSFRTYQSLNKETYLAEPD